MRHSSRRQSMTARSPDAPRGLRCANGGGAGFSRPDEHGPSAPVQGKTGRRATGGGVARDRADVEQCERSTRS